MTASGPVAARSPWHEPRIETSRLVLRPYVDGDAPAMVEYLGDFEVSRWLALVPHPYGPDHAAQFLETKRNPDPKQGHFGLAVETEGRFVGGTSLKGPGPTVMLGYWIGRPWWGRGLMTEAVGALLAHAFAPTAVGGMGLERIGSGVFEGNEASLAIQRRFGFTILGTSTVFSIARGAPTTHIDTLLTADRYRETIR